MIDSERLKALVRSEDWQSVYAMLDRARDSASTADDMADEVHWRGVALQRQQRFLEAHDLLQKNAQVFNSQVHVCHELSRLLFRLGRDQEALDALRKAPFEAELQQFYGLAIDAKFFYFYLLARRGEPSLKGRLSEIPDDYRYITIDGTFLTKQDLFTT